MSTKAYLGVLLLAAVPALPQAVSPLNPAPNDSRMATPPPVSGAAYPTEVGAEESSNYVRGGMKFNTAYVNNLYPGNGRAISETTYSILPTLALDQTTPRRQISILYSPGFTFYRPTSALNEVDQTAVLGYQVRPSQHSVLAFNDQFQYSSTSFGSGSLGGGGVVSGVTPVVAPGILAPFAKQLINNAGGEFTLQTSLSSMFGFSGTARTLHYPTPSEVTGLYDSNSRGGSAFYNRRISARQYMGATYSYTQVIAFPPGFETETVVQSPAMFYTIYPEPTLTLSVSAGPQRSQLEQKASPEFDSWSPVVTASIGWQGLHTNIAANYSQALTAGGGLIGPYHSRSGNVAARWQMSRTWTVEANANYAINKAVPAPFLLLSENGHSISGSAVATHSIGRQTHLAVGYDRIHQSYAGIPAISNNPDADRVIASISWEFTRPLGR